MIVTLTRNPSLDRTLFLDTFTPVQSTGALRRWLSRAARGSMLRWRCTATVSRLLRCFHQVVPQESS
jgi:hypothetical protein